MQLSDQTRQTLEFEKVKKHIADRCVSELGYADIAQLIPSNDLVVIQQNLRPVLECMDLIAFGDPLTLQNLPDIRAPLATSSASGALLSVLELLDVIEVLVNARRLHLYMTHRRENYPTLCFLTSDLTPLPALEEALNAALDPATQTIKDNASPDLRRIRRAIETLRTRIREQVEKILANLPDNVVQDRLVTMRSDRFVIPIRENQKGKVQGLVHDQSASGATLFVEPMATVELNNQLRQNELAERREVERILRQLTALVGQNAHALRINLDILGRFDAIYAKASFSRDLQATEPLFNHEGRILLRQARHPLLIFRLRRENTAQTLVPLNLTLGTDYWTLILTGPNAGGKTVVLKTLGLLSLMAQAGLPIPADEKSELPIFSGIFADIGDAQSIENDLSTFSSHVQNLVAITNQADSQALILLDEIGASTDPDEGSALAIALLNAFTQRQCRTLATTHHGALKAVAHNTPGMTNGSMAFDAETLRPTFHLRAGIPGSSYAFEIAERFGLDPNIVSEARELAGTDVRRVESLILDLDATYQKHQESLKNLEQERAEIAQKTTDYDARLRLVEDRERDLKYNAQNDARKILSDANALIERTVREIRESQAHKNTVQHMRKEIEQTRQELDKEIQRQDKTQVPEHLEIGDRVLSRTFGQEGIVLTVSDSRIQVEIGNLKAELPPGDLTLRQKALPKIEKAPKKSLGPSKCDVPLEIDVRGMIFDEAVERVDKYLDDAMMVHLQQARIIHGKGTGVLRRKLNDYFKTHPLIKSQRPGERGEGDWGVTVVELTVEA